MRLEKMWEEISDRDMAVITWRPFEIHPEVPPGGLPISALPYTPEELSAMQQNLRRQAEAEGLDFSVGLSKSRLINTHRALTASAYAQAESPECFDTFHRALFRAHFTEGKDLNDPAVLSAVAGTSGLDAGQMNAALDAGSYEAVLREATDEARRLCVTGVPTYIFGHRLIIVGAQSTTVLRKSFERMRAEL